LALEEGSLSVDGKCVSVVHDSILMLV